MTTDPPRLSPFVDDYLSRIEGDASKIESNFAEVLRRTRAKAPRGESSRWLDDEAPSRRFPALVTPASVPEPPAAQPRRWLAVAAAVVVSAGIAALAGTRGSTTAIEAADPAAEFQSAHEAETPAVEGTAAKARARPARPEHRAEAEPETSATTAPPPPEPAVEPAAVLPSPPVEAEPRRSRWERLEREAEQRLRSGEHERAMRLLLEIAEHGPARRAELAFAELFSLMRRRHGLSGQADAWSAYLERFPRGKFADDATAGLCRLAPEAERARCWADYLRRFPRGSHLKVAQRALAYAQ